MALLLVAAPADRASADLVDTQPSTSLCDDDALPPVPAPAETRCPDPSPHATRPADAAVPSPVLTRIFRPPRPPLD